MASPRIPLALNPVLNRDTFFARLSTLRNDSHLCDVTVIVGEKRFGAHKIVLSAFSPYFQAMFSHGTVECSSPEVTLRGGVDEVGFRGFLGAAYTSRVALTADNALSQLACFSFLQVSDGVEACVDFLSANLTPESAVKAWIWGSDHREENLTGAALSFISEHYPECSLTEAFPCLPFAVVADLVRKDALCPDEEAVFEAILRWAKGGSKRSGDLYKLLHYIRMPLLSSSFLSSKLEDPVVKGAKQCKVFISKVLTDRLNPKKRSLSPSEAQSRKRTMVKKVGVERIIALSCSRYSSPNHTLKVFTYRMGDNTTECFATALAKPLQNFHTSCFQNTLYSFDCSPDNGSASVQVLNAKTRSWREIKPRNLPMRSAANFSTCSTREHLFAWDSFGRTECYFPLDDRWVTLAVPFNNSLQYYSGVVAFNRFFACGGVNETSATSSVHCYSVDDGKWTSVNPMRMPRFKFNCFSDTVFIYAVGSHPSELSVERFDGYRWSPLPSLDDFISTASNITGVCSDRRLYVVEKGSNEVYSLDPRCHLWNELPYTEGLEVKWLLSYDEKLWAVTGYTTTVRVELYDPRVQAWITQQIINESLNSALVSSVAW